MDLNEEFFQVGRFIVRRDNDHHCAGSGIHVCSNLKILISRFQNFSLGYEIVKMLRLSAMGHWILLTNAKQSVLERAEYSWSNLS